MVNRILESLLRVFFSYCFLCLIFIAYRIVFALLYLPSAKDVSTVTFLYAFFTGWRFDSLVITFTFLPVLALELISAVFNLKTILSKTIVWVSLVSTFLLSFLLVVDIYYYSFFKSHIDSRVFGIVQDSTIAVLKSVYTDFPLFRIAMVLLISILLSWKVYSMIQRRRNFIKHLNFFVGGLSILLFLFLYFWGMRGTLKDKVLNMEESYISSNPFVNSLAVNGIYTFKESFYSLRYNYLFQDPEEYIKGMDLAQLVATHTGLPIDSICVDSPLSSLIRTTKSKTTALPNIIFFQMEGLGTVAWTAQQEHFNIIGDLQEEMKYGYTLKNFLSCQNGTISSLEGILLDAPLNPVGQSKVATKQFSSSVLLPFKQHGYRTTFLTAGTINWRNLNGFLPYQGFDRVEGSANILEHLPDAETFIWGVHDEYMFKYCWDKLKQAESVPQFIYAMTVNNHSPYETPSNYKVNDLNPDGIQFKIPLLEKDRPLAFRYACDQLAWFLRQLRNSPQSKNTIVVVTGDHCVHQEFDTPAHDLYYRFSVPLLLFIPEQYMQGEKLDTAQWASHKDIFPTLFNLALPETSYLHLGRNLLDSEQHAYAINEYRYILYKEGGIDLLTAVKYNWSGDDMHMESANKVSDSTLNHIVRKAEATNILRQYIQLKNTTGK